MRYPDNVCVHGNGFVQVSLGGDPHETRVHVWHPELPDCQHVNTQTHNHRFGFTSTVLRGTVHQEELAVESLDCVPRLGAQTRDDGKGWTLWTAGEDRLPTGNRPLVQQPGRYGVDCRHDFYIFEGQSYSMAPGEFHRTIPALDGLVVTLLTKTRVWPTDDFQASVMCREGSQPDQEYDRFQVPWSDLARIITDALKGTPFDGVPLW